MLWFIQQQLIHFIENYGNSPLLIPMCIHRLSPVETSRCIYGNNSPARFPSMHLWCDSTEVNELFQQQRLKRSNSLVVPAILHNTHRTHREVTQEVVAFLLSATGYQCVPCCATCHFRVLSVGGLFSTQLNDSVAFYCFRIVLLLR